MSSRLDRPAMGRESIAPGARSPALPGVSVDNRAAYAPAVSDFLAQSEWHGVALPALRQCQRNLSGGPRPRQAAGSERQAAARGGAHAVRLDRHEPSGGVQ